MGMAAGFMLVGHSSQMDYHTRCAEGPFLTSSREMPLLLWHTAAFGTRVPGPQRHQEGSYAEAKDKPCHDFLYISGAFRRLYPVGTHSKSMSCGVGNGSRAGRLNSRGRYSTKDSCGVSGSSEPCGDAKRVG